MLRALLIALLAASALAVAAPAGGETRYFGPAVLRPFGGASSAYDNGCVSWWYNQFSAAQIDGIFLDNAEWPGAGPDPTGQDYLSRLYTAIRAYRQGPCAQGRACVE